jgi:predicted nucleotidyltransferase
VASRLPIDPQAVAAFCRRHHVRRLALFGSVLRDDFTPESDVDVLVEFEPGCVPGLRFFSMEVELSTILGRKVDLHTPGFLSRYFRDKVLEEAETQYVADDDALDEVDPFVGMADDERARLHASSRGPRRRSRPADRPQPRISFASFVLGGNGPGRVDG